MKGMATAAADCLIASVSSADGAADAASSGCGTDDSSSPTSLSEQLASPAKWMSSNIVCSIVSQVLSDVVIRVPVNVWSDESARSSSSLQLESPVKQRDDQGAQLPAVSVRAS